MNRLFVYGSLKPGGYGHKILLGRTENARRGRVPGLLYDCGQFPALEINRDKLDRHSWVYGLVYDVKSEYARDLEVDCDRFEGYPRLFGKMTLPVFLESQNYDVSVYALVYHGKEQTLFDGSRLLPEGRWKI